MIIKVLKIYLRKSEDFIQINRENQIHYCMLVLILTKKKSNVTIKPFLVRL